MKKHSFWMIIGCTAPLLLIFFLPVFGITSNYSFLIFIIAMFGFHLIMPMNHKGHEHDWHNEINQTPKTENHESHQH